MSSSSTVIFASNCSSSRSTPGSSSSTSFTTWLLFIGLGDNLVRFLRGDLPHRRIENGFLNLHVRPEFLRDLVDHLAARTRIGLPGLAEECLHFPMLLLQKLGCFHTHPPSERGARWGPVCDARSDARFLRIGRRRDVKTAYRFTLNASACRWRRRSRTCQ